MINGTESKPVATTPAPLRSLMKPAAGLRSGIHTRFAEIAAMWLPSGHDRRNRKAATPSPHQVLQCAAETSSLTRKTKLAFVPPNPNELVIAYSNSPV